MSPSPPRILIVEDDEASASALHDWLVADGYQASVAANGARALEQLRAAEALPEAILLDLRMPEMDGWAFRAQQRRDPALANIPVVVMSGDSSPQAMAIDANAILNKPVESGALRQTLRRVVEEQRARADQARDAHAERLAAVGRLAAGMAHEINNPLAWITANLRLLQERVPELTAAARASLLAKQVDDVDEYLAETERLVTESLEGTARIREIVQTVRSFTQPHARRSEVLQLGEVLETAIKMVEPKTRHSIRIERDLQPVPAVLADETQLAQVFVNLLMNAADAIEAAGSGHGLIRVRTSTTAEGSAQVEVTDTGVGFPVALRDRVFEPFFTTKRQGEGQGLGLFLCHNIVRAHGGTLALESEPGRGTVARVTLPPADRPAVAPREAAPAPRVAEKKLKLLLVEDELILGRALQRLLGRRYEVTLCGDVPSALEKLEAEADWAAVLCDVHMPGEGGPELYQHLLARWPALARRTLFMSGGAISHESERFIDELGERVLPKPLEPEQLEAALRKVQEQG